MRFKNISGMKFSFMLFIALIYPTGADAMFKKYFFSSPISGVLIDAGKPVSNVEIKRIISGDGLSEEEVDSVFTDNNGRFEFSAVSKRRFLEPGFTFAVKTVLIRGEVKLNGSNFILFRLKRSQNYDLGGEGYGENVYIECDISIYDVIQDIKIVACDVKGAK